MISKAGDDGSSQKLSLKCVRACVRACVRVCVIVCLRVRACARVLLDACYWTIKCFVVVVVVDLPRTSSF